MTCAVCSKPIEPEARYFTDEGSPRHMLCEPNPLEGMTYEKWQSLSEAERAKLRDPRSLTEQLIGLEGWRVEVETIYGETRRFYVGRSTGWEPIHLEIPRRDSSGGPGAEGEYKSVRRLYKR